MVGPVLVQPPTVALPSWLQSFLSSSSHPAVYVSM